MYNYWIFSAEQQKVEAAYQIYSHKNQLLMQYVRSKPVE